MRITRRVHLAWHIAVASAGLLMGTALTLLPSTKGLTSLAWLIVGVSLIIIAFMKRNRKWLILALLGGMSIGLWRGANEQLQLAKYLPYYDQQVTIRGRVAEDTTTNSSGKQQIRLVSVQINQTPLHGQVWLSTSSQHSIKRGDILVARGKLSEGFGTLTASLYRAETITVRRPQPGDVGRRIRDWFATKVRTTIPEPQASLGISYTLGQSQGLSETIDDEFRLLGLTHLLVASGSQLTLIARFTRRPLSRKSKYLATLASSIMIGSFLLLTGLSPSMLRAALVSVLSLIAWYYGRAIHPIVLLLFVAGLTVLLQPSFMWGDVGWLLSFTAFGGIVILAPLLNHYFWGSEQEPGFFRYLLVSTVAAQILTLPIAVYTFGEYSPLAVVANVLILPLVSVVMLLTFVSGLAGALLPAIAPMISWPTYIILSYMTSLTGKLATLPWAHGEIKVSAAMLGFSYAAIGTLILFLWRQTSHNFRQTSEVA